MELTSEKHAYLKAQTLVGTLASAGVKFFCLSPGFRNSVLALALHELKKTQTEIEILTHLDERGAAFFALGLAKASQKPAAVICTSGTALANYHPAVLEASYSYTPLVVVSADRPSELIDVGANQSMRQQGIFSHAVRYETHLEAEAQLEQVEYQSAKALFHALAPVPGPVHLNIAFRDPFLPKAEEIRDLPTFKKTIEFENSVFSFSEVALDKVLEKITKAKRPLLALGPTALAKEELQLLKDLAKKLNAPLFAEKSSGAPFQIISDKLCSHFDLFLQNLKEMKQAPDLIFRIGAPLTSKFFNQWIEKEKCPQIVLDQLGTGRNPSYGPTQFISGSVKSWLQKINSNCHSSPDLSWTVKILEKEKETRLSLDHYLQDQNTFTEWKLHHSLIETLPTSCQVFLGNSMVIRDFENCAEIKNKDLSLYTNRGLSGIDGLISTALGVAQAQPQIPTLLLIGDISTLHDLSALSLMNRLPKDLPFTLGIINNGGGEIFRIVKTAEHQELEELFTTPQNVQFQKIAEAFDLPYEKREDLNGFKLSSCPKIVEFVITPNSNTQTRKDFWKRVRQ